MAAHATLVVWIQWFVLNILLHDTKQYRQKYQSFLNVFVMLNFSGSKWLPHPSSAKISAHIDPVTATSINTRKKIEKERITFIKVKQKRWIHEFAKVRGVPSFSERQRRPRPPANGPVSRLVRLWNIASDPWWMRRARCLFRRAFWAGFIFCFFIDLCIFNDLKSFKIEFNLVFFHWFNVQSPSGVAMLQFVLDIAPG